MRVRENGELERWGETDHTLPEGAFATLATIASGQGCGLRPDGSAECLGSGPPEEHGLPGETFTLVVGGWGYACGIRTDGTVERWAASTLPATRLRSAGGDASLTRSELGGCGSTRAPTLRTWNRFDGGEARFSDRDLRSPRVRLAGAKDPSAKVGTG